MARAEGLDSELLAQAWGGDTGAMAAFAELAVRCSGFDPGQNEYAPRLAEKAPPGSTERAAREAAARLLIDYCGKSYQSFPRDGSGPVADVLNMLRHAAERGDLVARAKLSFHGESEAEILGALSATDDPWVVERALAKVARLDGPIAQQVHREVFADYTVGKDDASRIKFMAARWRACELGAACGPNQYHELSQCLYLGNCGLGMDVRTYIQQRELSGWQFELMQKYLAALDARLAEQGIRLGGGR